MYANAPHASAASSPGMPLTTSHHTQVQQHGHPQGLPPAAAQPGGSHGIPGQAAAPTAVPQYAAPVARANVGATFVTGAYQSVGDPAIDRMIRLEAACKRFGSPF